MKIEIQCKSCRGTGLYRGFGEKQGFAVVCWSCGGSGKDVIDAEPFTGLKPRIDVQRVGRYIGKYQSVEQNGGSVSYEEFLSGKLPLDSRE